MTEPAASHQATIVEMASDMVAAYVSKNSVQPADIPALIASVHQAFSSMSSGSEAAAPSPAGRTGDAFRRASSTSS